MQGRVNLKDLPEPVRVRIMTAAAVLTPLFLVFLFTWHTYDPHPQGSAGRPALRARTARGEQTWREVSRVEGRSIVRTEPFTITGTQWRIRWHVAPRMGIDEPYLKLRVNYGHNEQIDLQATIHGPSQDRFILDGAGTYTVGVISHHDYKIWIDENTE